jgi:tight adherence protein B
MNVNALLVAVLAMVTVGGVFYAFVYPYMSGEIRAEKRQAALRTGPGPAASKRVERSLDAAQRRKQIADSLKELELKGKGKKVTLDAKLQQAGLNWSRSRFFMISAALGVAFAFLTLLITRHPLYMLPGAVVGGLGIPNWLLSFLRKRRIKKFIDEFPNAVDVIIRGIKAGLPVGDCLRIIASESEEPVRGEFRYIVESTAMGLSISEAIERLVERVPVTEANFFAIVINIQQKAGGNLSEALGNLSRVLRDRKKMQTKVKAMSSEAKASAYIIGALPFFVTGLVYLSSPRYIELLWITSTGRIVLLVSGFWMFIGVMVMKKMVSFDM